MTWTLTSAELELNALRLVAERGRPTNGLRVVVSFALQEPDSQIVQSHSVNSELLPLVNDSARLFAEVPYPKLDQPIIGIRVESEGLEIDPQIAANLLAIYAADDAAYQTMFMEKYHRWGNSETQFVIARQITRHFRGNPAYRCAAAVVQGYKAVELGHRAALQDARSALTTGIGLAVQCPFHKSPRLNGQHLTISVLTSLWHVDLALEDQSAFLDTLAMCRDRSVGLSDYFTAAYPTARSCILLGWTRLLEGDREGAKDLWQYATNLFKLAMRDVNLNKGEFYSVIRDIFISSHVAAKGLAWLAGQEGVPPPTHEEFVKQALRVTGEPADRLSAIASSWYPVVAGGLR